MDNTIAPSAPDQRPQLSALTAGKAVDILWDCAWEAVILTLLVRILGAVVVDVLGELWHQMTPSLPPGLAEQHFPAVQSVTHLAGAFLHRHSFAILFALFFVAKALARLTSCGRTPDPHGAEAALRRLCHRLSEEWFRLVVVNAFTAFVAVTLLQITQMFSTTHWIWEFVSQAVQPVFLALGAALPAPLTSTVGAFYHWFCDNQLKFTFWLFYTAAICDDLGLPNYKTLARWAWSRFGQRQSQTSPQTP